MQVLECVQERLDDRGGGPLLVESRPIIGLLVEVAPGSQLLVEQRAEGAQAGWDGGQQGWGFHTRSGFRVLGQLPADRAGRLGIRLTEQGPIHPLYLPAGVVGSLAGWGDGSTGRYRTWTR